MVESGPSDSAVPLPGEPDGFVDLVADAGVYVVFLAVEQDYSIFVQSIESAD